jgi:hypothetical protein
MKQSLNMWLRRALLGNFLFIEVVETFPAFYGRRISVAMFARARYLNFTPSQPFTAHVIQIDLPVIYSAITKT